MSEFHLPAPVKLHYFCDLENKSFSDYFRAGRGDLTLNSPLVHTISNDFDDRAQAVW